MIRVVYTPNWHESYRRETYEVPHVLGRRMKDTVAEALGGHIPRMQYFRNGVRTDRDPIVSPADWLHVHRIPQLTSGFVLKLVALFFVSAILKALAPELPPVDDNEDQGPTYGFGGIRSSRVEGRPLAIIWGLIRAGGQVISESIVNNSGSHANSRYRVQISYGEGPIYAIGDRTTDTPKFDPLGTGPNALDLPTGIQIDGNAAENLEGVEAHIRLGGVDQIAAYGYEFVETRNETDSLLDQTQTEATDIDAPVIEVGVTSQADQDSVWDDQGVAFDLTTDAFGAVRFTLRLPLGWHRRNNSNGIFSLALWSAIRYIELDAGNNPIASGGDFGDGYVRLKETRNAYLSTSPFEVDFVVPLFDPATYVPIDMGFSLEATGTGISGAEITGPTVPPQWETTGAQTAFVSALCWVEADDLASASQTLLDAHDRSDGGWRLQLIEKTFFIAPGVWVDKWVPVLVIQRDDITGTGTGIDPSGQLLTDNSASFVFDAIKEGDRLYNVTDGSNATVISVLDGIRILHTPLAGGTDNRWDLTDAYAVERSFHVFENVNPNNQARGHGEPGFVVSEGERNQLGFSYKRNHNDSIDRVILYGNGRPIWIQESVLELTNPDWSSDKLALAHDPNDSTTTLDGRLDEVAIYETVRTPVQFLKDYNNGTGRRGARAGGQVFGYRCDDNGGTSTTVNDYSTYSNDATTTGTGTTQGLGMVPDYGENEVRRSKFRVEIMRNNVVSTSQLVVNQADLIAVSGIVDQEHSYPATPVLSLEVQSSEQLAGSVPNVTSLISGVLVPVWDGTDAENPTFFQRWSRNPAWVCADAAMSTRYGLGQTFTPDRVDVLSLQELADYCDEWTKDHRGDFKGNHDDPLQNDENGDADGWLNMNYDSTTVDPLTGETRGSILIAWTGTNLKGVIPAHWKVGRGVRWSGMQTPADEPGNILLDTNYDTNPDFDGFEIYDIDRGEGGTSFVRIYYDRLGQGAPWTGSSLRGSINPNAPTGILEGCERRFQYDAVHDVVADGWEALIKIAATARAVPVVEGNRLRFRINKARTPVGFVGPGNYIEDSFEIEYHKGDDPTNALTVSFLDEDRGHARATAYDEHPSIQNSASLAEVRPGDLDARGIVRRSQATRHARYQLNVLNQLERSGRWKAGPDHVRYEVGDLVYASNELVDWGQGCRIFAEVDDDTVKLDREVVVGPTGTYFIRIRNPVTGEFETGQVSSAPGTYAAGDSIELTAALGFTPAKPDLALFYKDGDEFIADIVNVRYHENGLFEIEFVEYDGTIYDDDFGELEDPQDVPAFPSEQANNVAPENVTRATALELVGRNLSGSETVRVAVSWTQDPVEASRTGGIAVWYRETDQGDGIGQLTGGFVRATEVSPGDAMAIVPLPTAEPGDTFVFAIQPVSKGGALRRPDACTQVRISVVGAGVYPNVPTGFTAILDGDLVIYSWTPAAGSESFEHEIRRGGWILGQVVGVAPPGATQLRTRNWAGGAANSIGIADPTLYLRARAPSGRYSGGDAATVVFTPNYVGGAAREDVAAAGSFFATQSWEDYALWEGSGAVLTDIETVDSDDTSLKELRFISAGGPLTGTYETPEPTVNPEWLPESYFIEGFVVAHQHHPATWEELPIAWGDPLMARWTWEGPIDTGLIGEVGSCTLTIEVSIKPDQASAFGSWQEFKPGILHGVAFKFRLSLTRPATDYNLRVARFFTRISRVPRVRWEHTPGSRMGLEELLR